MGTLVFQATLGGSVNLIGPNTASTINFTLPSADGSSGQTWTTNGSGVLSFGTLGVAGGGTGVTTSTGTGSVVLSTSPTLVTPLLGTPTSGNFNTGTFTWPTFNQNTSGTAAGLSATLAVASGGTGQTSYTNGQLLIGNTTGNTLTKATLTAGTNITITNSAGGISIAAAGGSPAGSDTQVQYNNAGAFGASANLTFDGTTLSSSIASAAAGLSLNSSTAGKANIVYRSAGTQKAIVGLAGAILGTSSTDLGLFAETGSAIKLYANGASTNSGTFNQFGLGIGAAVPSSGQGITFPAAQDASSNANTLDDYEEGTFTPTATNFSGSTAVWAGTYTKIGNLVRLTIQSTSGSGGTTTAGSSYFSGIPFTPAGTAGASGTGVFVNVSSSAAFGGCHTDSTPRIYLTTSIATNAFSLSIVYYV
jgi:hypothetical protein